MRNFLFWIQTHKFLTVIAIAVLYLGWSIFQTTAGINMRSTGIVNSVLPESYGYDAAGSLAGAPMAKMSSLASDIARPIGSTLYPPVGQSTDLNAVDRKVVVDTNFSLLVKDVAESIRNLKGAAEQSGGFMVSSSINRPEEGGNGTLVVRVPSDRLDQYLEQVRGAAVRVVSENVYGNDITDQYTDVEARLKTLNNTKQVFEAMLSKATDVDEILRVQQSIFNVQEQIDSYQGQLKYLENTSKSSLVTIYLSTDELSLPYAPSEPWRPQVVFKTAVRSLMVNLRGIANLIIWAVVYSPIILVGLTVIVLVRKMMRRV